MRFFTTTCIVLTICTIIVGDEYDENDTPSINSDDKATWTDRQMINNLCGACHSMSGYFTKDRSLKSWLLTIKRMSEMTSGPDSEYSPAEITRMSQYLASNPYELVTLDPYSYQDTSAEEEIEDSVETPQPVSAPVKIVYVKKTMPAPSGFRSPSRATVAAKQTGYIAVVALAVLILTGLLRKKMRMYFRPIHNATALILFICLSIHGIIYIAEYGLPSVAWYWFGILGLIAIVITEAIGLFLRQLPRYYKRLHLASGIAGLILTIMHWVWIYI